MPKAKKLPSGNWRVRVSVGKGADGIYQYKSFTAPTKKEAEYLAAQYAAKKKGPANSMTLREAIERYIDSKDGILSPTTIYNYRKIPNNYFQSIMDTRIDDLTREDVQRAVNEDARRVSAKTVINAHGLLSAALAMFAPDIILRTTLPRKVKQLRRDLPSSEDIMRIVHGTEIELPVLLALCMCLRVSEVRGLRKSDIDGDKLYILRVIVTADGKHIEKELAKTDATRRVETLPPFLRDLILAAPTEHATELTGQAIYKRFSRMVDAAGLPHMRFHDLRHVSASDMHAQGIPDKVAADRGGWAGTQTMRAVYQHSFDADRQEADRRMNDYYVTLYDTNFQE